MRNVVFICISCLQPTETEAEADNKSNKDLDLGFPEDDDDNAGGDCKWNQNFQKEIVEYDNQFRIHFTILYFEHFSSIVAFTTKCHGAGRQWRI